MSHQKTQSPARRKTVNKDDNVNELAEESKIKIGEVDVLLEQCVRINKVNLTLVSYQTP